MGMSSSPGTCCHLKTPKTWGVSFWVSTRQHKERVFQHLRICHLSIQTTSIAQISLCFFEVLSKNNCIFQYFQIYLKRNRNACVQSNKGYCLVSTPYPWERKGFSIKQRFESCSPESFAKWNQKRKHRFGKIKLTSLSSLPKLQEANNPVPFNRPQILN